MGNWCGVVIMQELWWENTVPIADGQADEYYSRVSHGQARMSGSTAVICGLARNLESILPVMISRIEKLGEMFSDYRVVVFENDSIDGTLSILKRWELRNTRVDILSEDYNDPVNLPTRCRGRMDRMARYRNVYREFVAENYADFDFAVVVDMDLHGGWSAMGIANSFGSEDWDFVGSNGIIWKQNILSRRSLQYDAWAYRSYGDPAVLKTRIVNQMLWDRGEPMVRVDSCFGGLGLYRMRALTECAYAGEDCEHVSLHRQMAEKGMDRLFLNPSQVILYGSKDCRIRRWSKNIIATTLSSSSRAASWTVSYPNGLRPIELPLFPAKRVAGQLNSDHSDQLVTVPFMSAKIQNLNAILRNGHPEIPDSPDTPISTSTNLTDSEIFRMKDYIETADLQSTSVASGRRTVILLTCYMTGAEQGANLGTAGYSYDFVVQIFIPLLSQWAEVIPVPEPKKNLDRIADEVWGRGLSPLHVSFLPFQDVCLARKAPNVVVPAWEFPDIPNEGFNDNPQNDWRFAASQCESVFVGGPFTKETFESGGIHVPIHIVPVPTPSQYFELPPWIPHQETTLSSKVYQANHTDPNGKQRPAWQRIGRSLERLTRNTVGKLVNRKKRRAMRARMSRWFQSSIGIKRSIERSKFTLPLTHNDSFIPTGIVYTSIFNPNDGRKNWQDLLTAFQTALADCEDATLLVKLVTSEPEAAMGVINYYNQRDIPHRCHVRFICDYLSPEQMVELAQASTYYLQTTRAEGNCLPIMNFLAAGRPAISPRHSAIQDYFSEDMGFVVESHPEPAAWPHDPQLKLRTTWGRLVWPSLVDQIRQSYEVAKHDKARYERLSHQAQAKMQSWSHPDVVAEKLAQALDSTVKTPSRSETLKFPLRKAA